MKDTKDKKKEIHFYVPGSKKQYPDYLTQVNVLQESAILLLRNHPTSLGK